MKLSVFSKKTFLATFFCLYVIFVELYISKKDLLDIIGVPISCKL